MATQQIPGEGRQSAQRDTSGQHPPTMGAGAREHRDYSHIQGWGADLDHKNRPAYPMERTPPRLAGLHWDRPEDQPLRMQVYHSVERTGVTPVFGTSAPPSGLSGKIRALAYRLSENDVRHWLLLMLADRVNVLEGIGQDLMHGRIPNIFSEMGARSEFRYNRAGFVRKALFLTTAVGGGTYYLYSRRANRSLRRSSDRGHVLEGRSKSLTESLPDILSEMGKSSRSPHNRIGFVGKALLASAIVGGAYYLYSGRTNNSQRR